VTTLTQPLTPDEYRAQVVQQLKACSEPARALELLADVETMLSATHISKALERAFWTGLSQDLDLLAQQATLLDPGAAAALRAVITTARAVATRALRRLPVPAPATDLSSTRRPHRRQHPSPWPLPHCHRGAAALGRA
jgi:hypothetical protein